MNSQGRRRVPRIEGVRDLITAMDFVLAAIDKPKERSPEFVKFRDEIVTLVTDCETAINRVGKAEDIERLHGEAVEHEERAKRGLEEAQGQAGEVGAAARKEANRLKDKAEADGEALKLTMDTRRTKLHDDIAAFVTREAEATTRQADLQEDIDLVEKAQDEREKALVAKAVTMDAREARLTKSQDEVAAQRERFRLVIGDPRVSVTLGPEQD